MAKGPVRTVARDYLEDPFVTPSKPPLPAIPNILAGTAREAGGNLHGNAVNAGSMDFGYQFPQKALGQTTLVPMQTNTAQMQFFREKEREKMQKLRAERMPDTVNLSEIEVGEEASSRNDGLARVPTTSMLTFPSPEDTRSRHIQDKIIAMGTQSEQNYRAGMENNRVAVPAVYAPILPLKPALRPPGFTIANPTGATSTLNANAAPYNYAHSYQSGKDRRAVPSSYEAAANHAQAVNLRFSDPDCARITQAPEIANGLGQQAPTRQNFAGPFFVDTIPTARNPTAMLAQHDDEVEKLKNWFRDGQRPARQEEYARSIVASTGAGRPGATRDLGPIGSERGRDGIMPNGVIDTTVFLRLYENLNEYVDESRSGIRGPFTRNWKQAPVHMCDPTPDGNKSFFESKPATPDLRGEQVSNYPKFGSLNHAGIGANVRGAWDLRGSAADGGFGGTIHRR
jgi:hypothetical protein